MMTGYGYDAHSVQPIIPGMEEDCCNRSSQFLSGFRLSNAEHYGLTGDNECYHPPQCSATIASASSTSTNCMPRVSISDEELYKALNISPILHNNTINNIQNHSSTDFCPTLTPIDVYTMADSTNDYCYPSTSFLEQTMSPFENQAMYLPPDVISMRPSPVPRDVASPTFSIHSFAPTTSTANAEEEDLEVELINTMKAEPRSELADDIDMFLHSGASDNEFHSSMDTTTQSETSSNNPTPSSRLPYAKKLSASSQKNSVDLSVPTSTFTSTTSPLFLQTALDPTGFTPLLTPKSDAILQRKLSEASKTKPVSLQHHQQQATPKSRRESYPISTQSISSLSFDPFFPSTSSHSINCKRPLIPLLTEGEAGEDLIQLSSRYNQYRSLFRLDNDDSFEINSSAISTPDYPFPRDISTVEEEQPDIFSDIEIDDKSEEIAVDVVAKLFDGSVEPSDPKKARNSIDHLFSGVLNQSRIEDDLRPNSKSSSSTHQIMEDNKQSNDEILDDWETVNDDVLTERMEKLLKNVKKTAKKDNLRNECLSSIPSTSTWDSNFLPHVLEIFDIPDYKMQDDVVKALETIGFGDCNLKWFERKIVLAAFENASRAKSCLSKPGHEWLRFRSLATSPPHVQLAAREKASQLSAPKHRRGQTNASVARRMVENVLGKKSAATLEQRKEERRQLNEAKNAKKNTVQWD